MMLTFPPSRGLRQLVAVKHVQLRGAGPVEALARQEAHVLSGIRHPHIVGYRGFHACADAIFIVMEYCAGGDLFDLMARYRPAG